MTAATKDTLAPEAAGSVIDYPVKASTQIFAGTQVALDASGWLVPVTAATGLIVAGRADEAADNSSGGNGDIRCRVRSGVFLRMNSASADEITAAEIGDTCYGVDDLTVAKTDGSSSRSAAGKIIQVDAQGVWVKQGILA